MLSETYLDFCFVQKSRKSLVPEINAGFQEIFKRHRLHWYLDTKSKDGLEIVVAEIKGMSSWQTEEDVLDHLEQHASEEFWSTLQGYQFQVLPLKKGSGTCGNS